MLLDAVHKLCYKNGHVLSRLEVGRKNIAKTIIYELCSAVIGKNMGEGKSCNVRAIGGGVGRLI